MRTKHSPTCVAAGSGCGTLTDLHAEGRKPKPQAAKQTAQSLAMSCERQWDEHFGRIRINKQADYRFTTTGCMHMHDLWRDTEQIHEGDATEEISKLEC